ncbi:hypothetical protein MZA97_07505 [Haemophilus influenzae]|nr:hypothetical protein [Haemophilus influenzae]
MKDCKRAIDVKLQLKQAVTVSLQSKQPIKVTLSKGISGGCGTPAPVLPEIFRFNSSLQNRTTMTTQTIQQLLTEFATYLGEQDKSYFGSN